MSRPEAFPAPDGDAAGPGVIARAVPGDHRDRRPGALSNAVRHLKQCPPFEGLTPAECRRLEARARVRTFRPREFVYSPAEPGHLRLCCLQKRQAAARRQLTGQALSSM